MTQTHFCVLIFYWPPPPFFLFLKSINLLLNVRCLFFRSTVRLQDEDPKHRERVKSDALLLSFTDETIVLGHTFIIITYPLFVKPPCCSCHVVLKNCKLCIAKIKATTGVNWIEVMGTDRRRQTCTVPFLSFSPVVTLVSMGDSPLNLLPIVPL